MPTHILDELADAPSSGVSQMLRGAEAGFFERVGIIVEYEFFRRRSRPQLPRIAEFTSAPIVHRISALFDAHPPVTSKLSLQAVISDAIAIPVALGADAGWTAFVKRAEATARTIGFANDTAAGVAGAIQEMADNIVRHSDAGNSGIAAFSRAGGRFEYVVGDSGIGMLASLKKAPEFRSLRDDLEALPLAVTPGVSRFGRGIGFGYGFRAVFLPLRATSGYVRLRSGQAVLEIAGVGVGPDQGRCSQRHLHQGVVVSVQIDPNSR
jgi:anti-sigma regulatory factor (Ser/Thr protein kinase)